MTTSEKNSHENGIRLLIVDDHPVVRAGLNSMLRKQSSLKVVGSVHGGREALELLESKPVDVVLLDLRMPHMDGIQTLQAFKKLAAPPRVVILSNFEFDEEIYRAVEAGAMGYLVKDTSRDEIIAAIKTVYAGNTHFPQRIAERLSERQGRHGLSAREVQILELLSKGLTNKDIGRVLDISKFTVRNHVNRIIGKLEVCDRTEASTVAIEQGILPTH
ncbi:Two component transcriptional regulator, LuxR family [Acidisarcina polymorpha]|uniref:Two component transcriptional regulator, LuxR family n=1 Tax=Acidisarcina polymorpha TaxID=2211140 RepID=A0A2Z5FUU0_9BACT|nr:response regulator transcription factor [Acidisarcina polymorpha]AXC10254.1 Two component transcriptional regulator, LuxR family [Acidisarcina polymorpha]